MNNKILLALLILFSVLFSAAAVSASDVSVTDSYAISLVDDTSDASVPLENTADSSEISVSSDSNVDNDPSIVSLSSEDVLESADSNTLSTDTNNDSLQGSGSTKTPTQLVSPTTVIYYKGAFSITLKDADGNPLVGKMVNFDINGGKFSARTNANGVASVALSLAPGKYTAKASFGGDDDYAAASNVSSTINILATIKSNDFTKYYKGSAQYTATFYTSEGKALANTNVKVTVNGKTYTGKTNSNGVASLPILLEPGTYKIVSTDPVTGYQLTTTVKVLTTVYANDLSKVYTDGKKFVAKFLNANGQVLANKNVKFKINGQTYTSKTNANGLASLSLTNLATGTYKIISYNIDGLTKTNTVKVYRYSTTTLTSTNYNFLGSDSKIVQVKLLNKFGYAPGSGQTIKITVSGKTYTAYTDANGIARLKLPSLSYGSYTVKYTFDKTNFYTASSTTSKVSIIPSKNPTLAVKSTTTFGHNAGTLFKVALTSGNVPLEGKTVYMVIDGKTYTRTTDASGVASIPIMLPVGKYSVTCTNKAETNINSKSVSTTITVKERASTSLTWKSGTSFYQGVQTYKVLLKDASNNVLSGKTVKLTVNSKTYTATTDSNGIATFSVNVGVGNYTVSYSFPATGDNFFNPSSGSTKVEVIKKDNTGYGYWLFGGDMKKVGLSTLASQGTTDIFLNYYAITLHGKSAVESWIASANNVGIRVHIWMQTFYNGGWVNPVKNGSPNTAYFNQVINEAKTYAQIKGVSGIHFDYLRYPGNAYQTTGGTAAISQFVRLAVQQLHNTNPNLIVSCALMPETTNNVYYYGQDYSVISQYMDVVVPMIYKGNYGKTTTWIKTTSQWYVDNSKGAKVWSGLQGYVSDSNTAKLPASEIRTDSQNALNAHADGVIIFRWGLTNYVNFNTLSEMTSSPSTSGSVAISDILAAAFNLNRTIRTTGSLPASVSVGGVSYTTAQFLYMMTKATEFINSGSTSQILPISVATPSNPNGAVESGNLEKSDYVNLASRISTFIEANNLAPNYATSPLGSIKYQSLVDAFSRILAYYKAHNMLPNYVSIEAASQSSATVPTSGTISIQDIITGSTNLKNYYQKNGVLPNTVTAGGITFKLPEFLYLMSKAIYQIGNGNSNDINYIIGVAGPAGPFGDAINSQLTLDNYVTVAKNVANYINSNKQAPNYASSALGKIEYSGLVDAFSRVLAYYGYYSQLPTYVVITTTATSSSSASGSGLNENNHITDLSAYLKSTTNCQVGNSKIQSLVDSLTKGLTSDLAKAQAIFNYVRDHISYSFYYNTRHGAVGTYTAGSGNCVDQSHLLVAMFRTAKLPARYVQGTCKFSSGSTYGHVWTQVLVNGKWYVADATSSRNSFGSIANWNTNSFSLNGIYASLSF